MSFGKDSAVMRQQTVIEHLENSIITILVAITHGGTRRTLEKSQVCDKGLTHPNTSRNIIQSIAFIQLSETLIVGLITATTFVAMVGFNTVGQYPTRNQIYNFED